MATGDTVEISATLELPATRERAWALLADVPGHADWNPLVREAKGTLAEGQTLDLVDGAGRRRTVLVTSMCAPAELYLYWHHATPGTLALEHLIELDALSDQSSRITQRRIYRGAFANQLHAIATVGAERLRRMNQALYRALEAEGSEPDRAA